MFIRGGKMAKVRFILDGREVVTEQGSTVLEAAQENGVDIPTLCHDPRLKPYAACRICLVEVEGARGPVPACAVPVTEGMVVRTRTDNLENLRRTCLELLLSDHYGDCIAPCQLACPAGIDIQGFIALIADGQYEEALKLIKETMPLPAVCGRVCPRFCEQECRRNLVDEPLAIMALKRFVADYDLTNGPYIPEVKPATGRKVAVVGGGPAGLSAAYYLAQEGHRVTIFDAGPELGGMLRYGIPEYRLPKELLDKEIATITALCAEVRLNVRLGRDFTIESLRKDGYDAVFIALGAQASQKMRVEGEELANVFPGIQFLRDAALHKRVEVGRRVIVVGGGNTAIDAARTALRLGASEVTIVYRRSRDEMPASDEEVKQAEQEGVRFHFLAAPVRLLGENDRVTSVECIKMRLAEPDSSGRRRPLPVEGSEFTIETDTVIAAIGQVLDASAFGEGGQMALNPKGCVQVNEQTLETAVAGVFAGGDCVSGPATVVQAVAAGRRAALSINQYLKGEPIAPLSKPFNCSKGRLDEIDRAEYATTEKVPRTEMPLLSPSDRRDNFCEIELGFDELMAKREAMRCLSCGCQDVFDCKLRKLATQYQVDAHRFSGEKHHYPIHDDHPFIIRDANKCILCGSCLRICLEVQGVGAWSLVHRGFKTVIQPSLGLPLQETLCESCHQCVSACPTGALGTKVLLPKPGPWRLDKVRSICPNCSIGCNLELGVKGNKIVEVTSPVANLVNEGNLCRKGAFDYTSIHSPERVKVPLVRRDGQLVPVDWEEALAIAGKVLAGVKEQHGGERLAVLVSPKLTNEENYLAQKLARTALSTNNIDSTIPLPPNDALSQVFGKNASTCTFDDIASADLVLIFGCDVTTEYPVVASKIRKVVERGCKLAIVNPQVTRLDSLALMTMKINPKTMVELLQSMLNYILHYDLIDHSFVEQRTIGLSSLRRQMLRYPIEVVADSLWVKPAKIVELIHLYVRAKNPIIMVNADTITAAELMLLANLALLTGNVGRRGAGILALRGYGNSQGQIDMGVAPNYLPGQEPISRGLARHRLSVMWGRELPAEEGKGTADIIQGVKAGEIQGLLIVSSGGDFYCDSSFIDSSSTIVITPLLNECISKARVILPGTTFAETEGTFTNCERRIQRLHQAIPPVGNKQTWQILCELAAFLGYPMRYSSVSDIFSEIVTVADIYANLKYEDIHDGGTCWPSGVNEGDSLYVNRFWFQDGTARFQTLETSSDLLVEAHSL